jgi:hypothetical protein
VNRGREYAAALAIVALVQAFTWMTQPRIEANEGKGYDGRDHYNVSQQLAARERPRGPTLWVHRLGTPMLVAALGFDDIINGFQVVNCAAGLISTVLLLLFLRRYLQTPWLRLALVGVYATHWLQVVRFTFFYPVLVDPWTQVACLAGLNCIAWYEERQSASAAAAVAVVSMVGVLFRELVLLIPIAFLFARNPRLRHLRGWPYMRIENFPRMEQWAPIVLACASVAAVAWFAIESDPEFSSIEHLLTYAIGLNAIVYLLGWLIAFGPVFFIVLFDWRTVVDFFTRHQAFLVYTLGVAAAAWAGSGDAERHSINSASPIVYLLLGLTIERHRAWFRSPAFVTFLLVAQFLVHRVFLLTPQPYADGHYPTNVPSILLTPIGNDVTYLHLFSYYIPRPMVAVQFIQFVGLGGVVLFWLSRRAQLHGDPVTRTSLAA